jgi:hypothetical protein
MKKHRGLKRYYRNLERQNEFDKLSWLNLQDTSTWPEKWHLHLDWRGHGNNSFKRRKPHLNKLFRHFQFLADQTKFLKSEFQLYAIILDFHNSSDALFLHTASPNESQLPFKVEDLSKSTTLKNKDLDAYINQLQGYEKLYGEAREAFCLLYIKGIGKNFGLNIHPIGLSV